MNVFKFLLSLTCISLMVACGNTETDSARQAPVNNTSTTAPAPAVDPMASTPPPAEPAQNAEGVWHYTCSKGCAGGAGSATACAVCGATLEHNSLYHGQAAAPTAQGAATQVTSGTPPSMFADPNKQPVNATIGTAVAPSQTTEPAQNAAGVWHYTCSNGCSGGAGSEMACPKCGNTLAHNAAYHE